MEKGVARKDYWLTRLDVLFGCIVTDVIAVFIVVSIAATLLKSGHGEINDGGKSGNCIEAFRRSVCIASVWRRAGERIIAVRGHPSRRANGVLILFVLIFMLVLVNRKTVMGGMQNRGWQNALPVRRAP